jgi:ankyrin repeat protein
MDLHGAARTGDTQRILQLVGINADVNSRDKHSRTPLHLAAWAGQDVRRTVSHLNLL